jgi:hypothetical protein
MLENGPVKNPLARAVVFEGRKFATPNGKANLINEGPPMAARPTEEYPLFLLALSTPKSQCSQWADAPELPLPLTLHPSAVAGFVDGEVCELESVLGRMQVRLVFDAAQRRDVALLPKGGPMTGGGCANRLIRARTTDLGEGGALYEERVRLRRA